MGKLRYAEVEQTFLRDAICYFKNSSYFLSVLTSSFKVVAEPDL